MISKSEYQDTKKAESTFMGVCAYIANSADLDVFIVRLFAIAFLILSFPIGILIYVLVGIYCIED